jgi:hypothetical protein
MLEKLSSRRVSIQNKIKNHGHLLILYTKIDRFIRRNFGVLEKVLFPFTLLLLRSHIFLHSQPLGSK